MSEQQLNINESIINEIHDRDGSLEIVAAAQVLTMYCHGVASECGWWDKERNVGELLMLCVSELAEAMEGHRKELMDDHLPHRNMLEVELADTIIRVFDMAGGMNLDVAGAIAEKMQYNTRREDHKREAREAEGGKKY